MTTRRLLAGLFVVALLSVFLAVGWNRGDDIVAAQTMCADDADEWWDARVQQEAEQFRREFSERLAASAAADNLMAAALLAENNSAAQINLLHRAVAAGSTEPFVLFSSVRICSESGDPANCPLQDWEQLLIAADRQNSEAWRLVAANRYAAGDEAAALEAMQFAVSAAATTTYWPETIESFERGLRFVDNSMPLRMADVIGFAATESPGYGGLVEMCSEASTGSSDWADVCLDYAQLLERQGKTYGSTSIARSIQKMMLEAQGASERIAAVEERARLVSRELAAMPASVNAAADLLIAQDAGLYEDFLEALRAEGEPVALQRLAEGFERLAAQQPELVCE